MQKPWWNWVNNMRVRNLPWAKDYLPTQPSYVEHPEDYKGKWHEVLQCEKLHLEIGSGKGDYWNQMSIMYPSEGWIGMERNVSVAAMALKKVENESQKNRLFLCQDAKDLECWFQEKELDVIHLNFSDPWPKKRNTKRRLSHHSFLEIYKKLLKEDGCIIMKTDNTQLFEFSLLEFAQHGFKLQEVYLDYRKSDHPEDAITEYESKFMKMNHPIYRGIWRL